MKKTTLALLAVLVLSSAITALIPSSAHAKGSNATKPSNSDRLSLSSRGERIQINGRNVGQVSHSQGSFLEQDNGNWVELGNNGASFKFREINRDDWSVYLVDQSRGVNIQLDLHRKKVVYSDNKGARFDLYTITTTFPSNQTIYNAYFTAGYGYCDAQMLGAFWNTSPAGAKFLAGKALLGLPGFSMNVPNKLVAARRIYTGRGICNFSSDFSYQDAVALASYWKVPISQSKAALTSKLEAGNLQMARNVVREARKNARSN